MWFWAPETCDVGLYGTMQLADFASFLKEHTLLPLWISIFTTV